METVESLKRRIGRPLWQFRDVVELRYHQLGDPRRSRDPRVDLTIRTEDAAPVQLSLRCRGVHNFRVKSFDGQGARILGFDIEAIEGSAQGLRWEVLDVEDDVLGFLCRDIEIVSVGPP